MSDDPVCGSDRSAAPEVATVRFFFLFLSLRKHPRPGFYRLRINTRLEIRTALVIVNLSALKFYHKTQLTAL